LGHDKKVAAVEQRLPERIHDCHALEAPRACVEAQRDKHSKPMICYQKDACYDFTSTISPRSGKDSHSLVLEAREMVGGLPAMAGATEGTIDTLTADQLYYLFAAVGEKLDTALVKMETE